MHQTNSPAKVQKALSLRVRAGQNLEGEFRPTNVVTTLLLLSKLEALLEASVRNQNETLVTRVA